VETEPPESLEYPSQALLQGPVDEGPVFLRDGTPAWLRQLRPDDCALLHDFTARLAPESRAARFFVAVGAEAAEESLVRDLDRPGRVNLIILVEHAGNARIVAHGVYARESERSPVAEVAFLVDDAYHGRGLGTLLLERLALHAVQRGVERFRAFTQPENAEMLEVFHASGFPVEERLDAGEVSVSFAIGLASENLARHGWREKAATVASLYPLFHPKSVVVVAERGETASAGRRIAKHLRDGGFAGEVWEVEPGASATPSLNRYESVRDLPAPIDLAVVAGPADHLPKWIEELADRRVRAVIVVSGGFAEAGAAGAQLQAELRRRALAQGIRILGPNSLGLLNSDGRLNASGAATRPRAGPISVASQSGAVGLELLALETEMGYGFASVVTLGNKADVSGNDLLQFWGDDPSTRLIVLYLASFGNPRRFARLARRIGRKKPILIVTAGRTAAGGRAASVHGPPRAVLEAGVDAMCRQAGILRLHALEDLFHTASILLHQPLPAGPRTAVVTNAGGLATISADALKAEGLELPETSPASRARWAALLPRATSVANPLSLGPTATPEEWAVTLRQVLTGTPFDHLVVVLNTSSLDDSTRILEASVGAIREAREAGSR
jgi:succinyl-CoA synthetase alpha subunit/GNAT superfamily N-acetyltransferase